MWGSEKSRKGPAGVVVNVGGEAQLGARPHNPRQRVDHAARYKAPFVVPAFWPRVRVEQEHPRKKRVWSSLDNRLCVPTPQERIGNVFAPERRKRRNNPIEEWLATDNPDIPIGLRLLNKMFAGAETDFQPHLPGSSGKHSPLGQVFDRNREQRQRFGEQTFLACSKRLAAAAPKKRASGLRPLASVDSPHWNRLSGQLGCGAQRIREISLFPREAAISLRHAPKMTIGRRAGENRAVQF